MFQTEQTTSREKVAGEVRAAMARKRITAAALSAQVDISKAALSRKLNAKACITIDELLDIAEALGVDAGELLTAARAAA
jgi:DNA-binding Xre family transcriptional regulator